MGSPWGQAWWGQNLGSFQQGAVSPRQLAKAQSRTQGPPHRERGCWAGWPETGVRFPVPASWSQGQDQVPSWRGWGCRLGWRVPGSLPQALLAGNRVSRRLAGGRILDPPGGGRGCHASSSETMVGPRDSSEAGWNHHTGWPELGQDPRASPVEGGNAWEVGSLHQAVVARTTGFLRMGVLYALACQNQRHWQPVPPGSIRGHHAGQPGPGERQWSLLVGGEVATLASWSRGPGIFPRGTVSPHWLA